MILNITKDQTQLKDEQLGIEIIYRINSHEIKFHQNQKIISHEIKFHQNQKIISHEIKFHD